MGVVVPAPKIMGVNTDPTTTIEGRETPIDLHASINAPVTSTEQGFLTKISCVMRCYQNILK